MSNIEITLLDDIPPPHELATWFPELAPDEYAEMARSIERHGIQNPITLFDGSILDGAHRARAAKACGIAIPARELPEGLDPIEYVAMQNLKRRHMTPGQLAMLSARLLERSREQGTAPKESPETIAKNLGASSRSTRRAQRVMREADPQITNAVANGTVELVDAERICNAPQDLQIKALDQVQSGKARTLSDAIRESDVEIEHVASSEDAEVLLLDPTLPAPAQTKRTPPQETERRDDTFTGPKVATPSPTRIERARDALGRIEIDPASDEKAQEAVAAERAHSPLDPDTNWRGRVWLRIETDAEWAAPIIVRAVEAIDNGTCKAAVIEFDGPTQGVEGLHALLRCARRVVIPYPKGAPSLVVLAGDDADPERFAEAWIGAGMVLTLADRNT